MNWGNVSAVEVLCLCATAAGVLGCARNLVQALAERAALRRAGARGEVAGLDLRAKRQIAHANLRGVLIGGALFTAAFLLSGIWAATPPPVRASLNFAQAATSAFILGVTLIAVYAVWVAGIERERLYDLGREAEREATGTPPPTGEGGD